MPHEFARDLRRLRNTGHSAALRDISLACPEGQCHENLPVKSSGCAHRHFSCLACHQLRLLRCAVPRGLARDLQRLRNAPVTQVQRVTSAHTWTPVLHTVQQGAFQARAAPVTQLRCVT